MSEKWHVNPETGKVGKCTALKKCRFGLTESEHRISREEAQKDFEKSMEKKPQGSKSNGPKLFSILNLELLQQEIANRHINVAVHPDDPSLKILSYSHVAQTSGSWNEATKISRGMIVRSENPDFSDAEIIARPWRKFYTLQQLSSGWGLGDEEEDAPSLEMDIASLDFSAPAEVTDKMDGSMGVLYRHPDGIAALSTKGSFQSDQAFMYTAKLRKNPEMLAAAEDLLKTDRTHIFELVGRNNQIVLDYPKDDIVLLGSVELNSGVYHSPNDENSWTRSGFTTTETMQARNLGEAVEMADREDKEGVVVRILSSDPKKQMQIKVKQADYLALHRLVTNFSGKTVRETFAKVSGVKMSDILKIEKTGDIDMVPQIREVSSIKNLRQGYDEINRRRREAFSDSLMPAIATATSALRRVQSLPESFFKRDGAAVMKDIAQSMNSDGTPALQKSFIFKFVKSRAQGENLLDMKMDDVFRLASKNVKLANHEE